MSAVPTPLQTLIVEDQAAEAKLIVRELERAGFDPKWERVENEEDFVSRLKPSLDVILADYTMPHFGASRALELLQQCCLDIPFIIISGTTGEDIAVAAMKQGAADYLFKDRLNRLGSVVNRVLKQSRLRREHQRTADELGPAQEQLSHLLAHTPAVIYVLKIEGDNVIPVVVSENVERLLGVTVTESMQPDWWLSSVHPKDRDRAAAVLAKSLKGDGYSMEYRIRHKDGSYHWVQDNNRVIPDAAGKPKHAVGVWTDITERKRSEDRLREQADIINRAHDAIMIRTFKDRRITFWNRGAERLYGWSAAEALGCDVSDLLYRNKDQFAAASRKLIEQGEWVGELHQRCKSGDEVIVNGRWTLVHDEKGQPKSVLTINADITEQKKLETQLLRAQRLESIGTLASGVAHDLNNILVPILIAAPVLRHHLPEPERLRFLDIVESSAQRGAQIVRQVLTFARGADGDRVLLQPIYLLAEIAKIVEETFPRAIRVRTSYPENLWLIEGDSTQLHQVLLNLCLNARDSMPEGGSLSLNAENFDVDDHYATMTPGLTPGPHVLINVIDSGRGIAPQIIDKIFDPFFTTKELGKGTGLGLSTVLGIVKSHGGVVNVYTGATGTTFRVLLPAAPGAHAPAELDAKIDVPTGHGETILLVDDESAIREVAKAVLSQSGYKVLTADDGPSALAIFAQQSKKIAVVLTDSEMPIMSGLMLARILRKMQSETKIILSSARDGDYREAELANVGVHACLNKPYTRETLLRMVDGVLTTR